MINVLLISHSIIPSVLLCGHEQLEYLKAHNRINYKYVVARKTSSKDLSWADIIIFVRSESYKEALVSELCKGKKHMIYVLDDDLLNLPDYISCAKYYKTPGIHNNILKIMSNCNTFLTPSKVLKKKYGDFFNHADLIDEPSLNHIKDKKENEKIKIGFAGSIDRTQDINDILTSCLEKIINYYHDDVCVEFMGAKPEIANKYNLKYIPYQNGYQKYTEIMKDANWDIGLAPLPISDFHSCKYFNKYVEYASFGIAGIYTNCEPYISGIKDKENGLLVNNIEEEWVNALKTLIEDEKLRKKIIKNCIDEANSVYSIDTLSNQYFEKITKGFDQNEKNEINILFKHKLEILFAMVKDKIMVQRWRFPIWCVKYIFIKIKERITNE